MSQRYLVLDYETFSEADLKACGAWEYSKHPTTEILCAAWRIGTRETLLHAPTKSWAPRLGNYNVIELTTALEDPTIIRVAHNAFFEQVITANVFYKMIGKSQPGKLEPERWICTASLAAALAVPRSLEAACAALKLKVQKDMEGNRLIKKWCKPKKPSKANPATRYTDTDEFNRIVQYCETDIAAEVGLFLKCPPLSETERKVWVLDQQINLRGFEVDRPLVTKVLKMIDAETKVLNEETVRLSGGILESATQRNGVLEWLEGEGFYLPDLRAKTVADALGDGLVTGDAARMLEIRQAISKTSTAKYEAFELRSRTDSRLRDILLYWAASTGRWGGRGLQPHNFPRGTIKNSIKAAEILAEGDLELIRLIYGDPMTVFSSCLRNMIVAPRGKLLDVADFNAIETRGLFWVARHERGLRAFINDEDLYCQMASVIYGRTITKKDALERQLGKKVILGCGYQMGGKKFFKTCQDDGMPVTEELAEHAVRSYRQAHAPVVVLWNNIGRAAIAAVENPGKRYTVNRTTWESRNGFLWCHLPSGRKLAYAEPQIRYEKTPWDEKRAVLYHWGINALSKKWENQKTYGGKLVENVVQAISRDVMASAMLRIEDTGIWKIVLSVHDELIGERNIFESSGEIFNQLMAEIPSWGEGFPIKVEGWTGNRYRK